MSFKTSSPDAGGPGSSEHLLRTYERIAPSYDLVDAPFEFLRYRAIRPLLFRGLSGRLLDAGVGTGRNVPFYPAGSEMYGVDLSPAMLKRAERRARKLHLSVHLIEMDLGELTFADDFFDSAVASFVFCTMPPDARATALRELRRVVKPSGRIRLLEYAPAQSAFRRRVARIWQPWAEWAFGAKLDGNIEAELSGAALKIIDSHYVGTSIKLIEASRAN